VILKRTGLVCKGSEKSQLCVEITVGVRSDVPLPSRMVHTAVFATGEWLCR